MAAPPEGSETAPGEGLVAGRYRLDRAIGQGGVAVVYQATDLRSGQRLALKRLQSQSDPDRAQRLGQLFEREYHVLCQLSHPRIVTVHDYAIDDAGPYYTMELLDGGDLHALAPLPWASACAVARDVCSALSLLHSRRLVHRDISARNVRCTEDGLAKLIDFGAMVPMGPVKYIVGTPPFCAPEVVQRQPIDGRADLFALGAALYFTLAGRHAYPARDFAALRDLWSIPVLPPSAFARDVPAELDALVLDILRLDPEARPANAAEVMERLAGIEGVPLDENLFVAQAYLTTPGLVGRDASLERVQKRTRQARNGRGSPLLVCGAAGTGRSRFLDACALQARTYGMCVLRADADDARDGEYGTVRALCRQLLQAEPSAALAAAQPYRDVLGHALPELKGDGLALKRFDSPDHLRPELQAALRKWLLAVARDKPLFLVVDDMHRVDEPSAALFALLAGELRRQRLLLLASSETGAPCTAPAALRVLSGAAKQLTLGKLSLPVTRQLLGSVFGEVPHLELLSHRLHTLSGGNPRDIMRLAQHLLDSGVLRYRGGAWSLPASIDPRDLPSSMAQTLRERLAGIDAGARSLARAFALRPEVGMSFDDCLLLCGHGNTGTLQRELDSLIEHAVLKLSGEHYSLAQQIWSELLLETPDPGDGERHRRLARLFEQHADGVLRAVQHHMRAGEEERALDMLVQHAEDSRRVTDQSADEFVKLVASLPDDWYETYGRALRLSERLGRPARERYALQSRLAGMIAVMGVYDREHLPALFEQLARFSGLVDWAALDPAMEPMARLVKALELAQQRHQQSAEHERVIDPAAAIPQLARALIQASAMIAAAFDLRYLARLPSLSPLAPLSPALAVIDILLRGVRARMTGHRDALALYLQLLERTAQPDRAGLDESHHRYMRLGVMSGVGMLEAALGRPSSLDYAAQCEADVLYKLNGMKIRMLYHLWRGDVRTADRLSKQIELQRIQNAAPRFLDGTHLTWQMIVHTLSDDLTRTKETLLEIEPMAAPHEQWRPVRHFGLAELHRIRGDHPRALAELEAALSTTAAGEHQIWPSLAGANLRTLIAQERFAEACAIGAEYMKAAEQAELGDLEHYIRMPLAIAQACCGDAAAAVANAERVIAELDAFGAQGLRLGLAYETRARVALVLDDPAALERYSELCGAALCAHDNPALAARLARLRRAAQRTEAPVVEESRELQGAGRVRISERVAALDTCKDASERAQCALSQLAEHSGSSRGLLYVLSDNGLERLGELDAADVPEKVDALARDLLRAELEGEETTATSFGPESAAPRSTIDDGGYYYPVILRHPVDEGYAITGVAMLWAPTGTALEYPARLAVRLSQRLAAMGVATSRGLA